MRHVSVAMGTVLSLEANAATNVDAIDSLMAEAEARFSLYRADSELSRVATGGLALTDTSVELRTMYALALRWRDRTAGAFTPHRPDGTIDLNGIVKAHAMQAAADLLGGGDWCLNIGGDIVTSGCDGESPWTVGIVDPADRSALLTSVAMTGARRSLATSGSAERGDHIWTRARGPAEYRQVCALADDIVTADVLATAIVSGGRATLDGLTARFDVDVLAIEASGRLSATPGMRALVTA